MSLDNLLKKYLDFDDQDEGERKVLSMEELLRALKNAKRMGAIYSTSMVRGQVELLENLGFLKGEWFGHGNHLPHKMWRLTSAGEAMLSADRKHCVRKVSGTSLKKTPMEAWTPQEADLSSRLELSFDDLFITDDEEKIKKVG